MVYGDKGTGVMVGTDCELSGKHWEVAPVQPKSQPSKEAPKEEPAEKETTKRTTAKSTAKKTR